LFVEEYPFLANGFSSKESDIAMIDVEAESPGILGKILVRFLAYPIPYSILPNVSVSFLMELPMFLWNKLSH
jgi:hypothetical protein